MCFCLRLRTKVEYVMRCAIWYHLYNLKNVKNNHGGVLILVKLKSTTYWPSKTTRIFKNFVPTCEKVLTAKIFLPRYGGW